MKTSEVEAALRRLRLKPSSLPKEPHSFRLLDRSAFPRLARARIRLARKLDKPIAENVCYGCGRLYRRVHAGRVNCDICIRVRKVLR